MSYVPVDFFMVVGPRCSSASEWHPLSPENLPELLQRRLPLASIQLVDIASSRPGRGNNRRPGGRCALDSRRK